VREIIMAGIRWSAVLLTVTLVASSTPSEAIASDTVQFRERIPVEGESAAPHRVVAKRPSQVFEFFDGRVAVKPRGLDAAETAFAEQLADSLNTGAANGWLIIRAGSSEVSFTPSGKIEVEKRIREASHPCVEISNVTVSWQGYAFDMQTTCSESELQAALGLSVDDGSASEPVVRATQGHTNPVAPLFGEDFWCWVSVAGLILGVVSAVFLLAFPPTTGLGIAWASVIITLGLSYIGTVANCTGILAVRVSTSGLASLDGAGVIRKPQGHYVYCYYGYSYGYKYDSILKQYVPTKIRWNC
jgi:hypothetical protein